MGNIVWIASYPKSGNTWIRAFLYHLLTGQDDASPINQLASVCDNEANRKFYAPFLEGKEETPALLASLRTKVQQQLAIQKPTSTLLKTHNYYGSYEGFPLQDANLGSAVVYIVRNPLDVVLSVSHHYQLTVDEGIAFLNREDTSIEASDATVGSFLASWSTHVESWTKGMDKHPRYCILRYEDILLNPAKSFKKVAKLIGVSDPKRLKQAIAASKFANLQKQEKRQGFVENPTQGNLFFRKGLANQWRSQLSDEQVSAVCEANKDTMKRFNYLPKR